MGSNAEPQEMVFKLKCMIGHLAGAVGNRVMQGFSRHV